MERLGIAAGPERTRVRDSAKAERLRRIGVPAERIGPAGTRVDLDGT